MCLWGAMNKYSTSLIWIHNLLIKTHKFLPKHPYKQTLTMVRHITQFDKLTEIKHINGR